MQRLACFLLALLCLCNVTLAQIYYTPPNVSPTIPVGCDVFSSNPTQSGYVHYGELGGVAYTSTSSNGIALPCSYSTYPGSGTAYTIGFPFTLGKAYTITVTAFSSYSGVAVPPDLWFSASTSKYTASPSCTQVSQYTIANLFSTGSGGIGVSKEVMTPITSSTSQAYTILSNYYPIPGLNYINLATYISNLIYVTYAGTIYIQEISWTAVSPPIAPEINGSGTYYFSATHQSGNGTITGTPGATITVYVGAGGPPPSNYTTSLYLTGGVTFTDGTTSITATNTDVWKQFVVPSGGSVGWNGTFSEPNDDGSGAINVY
jgi:hypothetical protein